MATIVKALAQKPVDGIRPFDVRRDLAAVADLVELCFAETLDQDGRLFLRRMRAAAQQKGLLQWAAATAEWASAPFTGYVWLESGRVIGNASLVPYYLRGERFFLIANVAVHPDYRRRGIARALTERAIAHARQRGASSVWLHVREENQVAENLYRSQGFIERTRRTTWQSMPTYVAVEPAMGAQFTPAHAQDWHILQKWFQENYPPELAWYLMFNAQLFRPGIWGALLRLINGSNVMQWAARGRREVQAAVGWQITNRSANSIWLAAPGDADEQIVRDLLQFVRWRLSPERPLTLDYPAGSLRQAIESAGFREHQTLLWMELPLIRQ